MACRFGRLDEAKVDNLLITVNFYFIYVHFCLPKNEPKRAPRLSRPFGLPCASRCCRDAGNSASPQTCQRPFSATPVMLSWTEWGPENTNLVFWMPFHAAEQRKNNRKSARTVWGEASYAAPGYFEQHREAEGQVDRLPFLWFVSLGKQRNERH